MRHLNEDEALRLADGSGGPELEGAWSTHLASCSICEALVRSQQGLGVLLAEAADVNVRPGFADRVARLVDVEDRSDVQWLNVEHVAARAVLALGLAAGLLLAASLLLPSPAPAAAERFVQGMRADSTTAVFVLPREISRDEALVAVVSRP